MLNYSELNRDQSIMSGALYHWAIVHLPIQKVKLKYDEGIHLDRRSRVG